MSVFTQGSGQAAQRSQPGVREVVQSLMQSCRVAVVEHGSEAADQAVSGPEFRAVAEEPGQAVVDVRAAAVRVGGDPAGGFARGGWSLAWFVHG